MENTAMKNLALAPVVLALAAAFSGVALPPRFALAQSHEKPAAHAQPAAAHAPHWSYEGAGDPSHWSTLSKEFATCGVGHEQSPIDIVTAKAAPLQAGTKGFDEVRLDPTVRKAPVDIVNNGHTIQVDVVGTESLTIGKEPYVLQQFHFHSPSEHTVDGKSYPLEAHFVHKSADGRLAVIGVLFEEGAENVALAPFWRKLPTTTGGKVGLGGDGVSISTLLPALHEVYRYPGSLTTPPCSEAVKWLVMRDRLTASAAQIAALKAIIHVNNRPVQPLLGRVVYKDTVR
jgi:carbonic anhydrase